MYVSFAVFSIIYYKNWRNNTVDATTKTKIQRRASELRKIRQNAMYTLHPFRNELKECEDNFQNWSAMSYLFSRHDTLDIRREFNLYTYLRFYCDLIIFVFQVLLFAFGKMPSRCGQLGISFRLSYKLY